MEDSSQRERMQYRVVRVSGSTCDEDEFQEVARFATAYRAVDYLTAAWYADAHGAGRLYILDEDGFVLLTPEDLLGITRQDWEQAR